MIDLRDPGYVVRVDPPLPRANFSCVYIRPVGDQFELVMQWVRTIGTDFTFDEKVLLTSNTPLVLMSYFNDPDFIWPLFP